MAVENGDVASETLALVESLVAELPRGTCKVSSERDIESGEGDLIICVSPSNLSAAPFELHVAAHDEGPALFVGRDITIEFDVDQPGARRFLSSSSKLPTFADLPTLIRAVFHGNVEEWLWMHGEDIAKSVGIISTEAGRVKASSRRFGPRTLRHTTKVHIAYEPYVPV